MKKKLVVVGGGTAGWITLSYLAATTDLDLTIIHSNEIEIIGVGESTTPTIRYVAQTVGVDETKWMKDGRATYKYGIDFIDFNQKGSSWIHTFDDLIPSHCFHQALSHNGKEVYPRGLTSVEYFLKLREKDPTKYNSDLYNRMHGSNQFLFENRLSPYGQQGNVNIGDFPGYGYHINAFEFGNSLREATPKDKYSEIVDTIIKVNHTDDGIKSVVLKDGTEVFGDIFFDCTGQKRLLIGDYTSYKKYEDLRNNQAVFGGIENYKSDKPATEAIAQEAGWIWAIPTANRLGSGYVFSSDFITEEHAVKTISDYWASKGLKWEHQKTVKFVGGRLEDIAIKNIASNGLCQSFIEPLEATSIMVTCVTVMAFARQYNKHNDWSPRSSQVLSTMMKLFLEDTKDFVRYHYELSNRTDNDYWMSYKNSNVLQEVSDRIDKRLAMSWVNKGETVLNGWNWTSMLLGFDKQYVNKLPDISETQLEEYKFYADILQQHYMFLNKNNITIEQRLKNIHG
jgi:tryptophan halogenase